MEAKRYVIESKRNGGEEGISPPPLFTFCC